MRKLPEPRNYPRANWFKLILLARALWPVAMGGKELVPDVF